MKINEYLLEKCNGLCQRIQIEENLSNHWDVYIRDLWAPSKLLLVASNERMDTILNEFVRTLQNDGYEIQECLLNPNVNEYRDILEESIADGRIEGISAILSVGGKHIYNAARHLAAQCDLPFCGFLTELPDPDVLYTSSPFTDEKDTPLPRALFLDLSILKNIPAAQRVDLATRLQCQARAGLAETTLYPWISSQSYALAGECFSFAEQAISLDDIRDMSVDTLQSLCEGVCWLSIARHLAPHPTALEMACSYQARMENDLPAPMLSHLKIFTDMLLAWTSIDELELDADSCAQKHLPADIRKRTILQHLLEDSVATDLMPFFKSIDIDRQTIRTIVQTLQSNWENMIENVSVPLQHCIAFIEKMEGTVSEPDAHHLREIWQHASDAFALPAYLVFFITSKLRDED